MLPEIKGDKLPSLPWRDFAFDEVLDYYDGPRMLLERGLDGELYLAWWNDTDSDTDRWLCLPVSLPRLHAVLSGQMPARQAMRYPEDGYLLVVDFDVHTGAIGSVVKTTADAIPQNSLPHPDTRLNIPLPPSAQAQWADTVALGKSAALAGEAQPAESLAVGAAGNAGPSAGKAGESVLEMFDRIHREMPEGAFDGMPTDGARNYKHYLYGWPKDDE